MSPAKYPLVAFGDARKHAHQGRYIEGPLDLSASDSPINVDDITRSRKEKEKMWQKAKATCDVSSKFDRRCLTGVKKLEGGDGEGAESRLRRLLDGAVPVPVNESIQRFANGTQSVETGWTGMAEANRLILLPWVTRNVWEAIGTAVLLVGVSLWFVLARGTRENRNFSHEGNEVHQVNIDGIEGLATSVNESINGSSKDPSTPVPSVSLDSLQGPMEDLPPPLPALDDGEDSDGDGDDDVPTSGKRRGRRGRRGKKKKPVPHAEIEQEKEVNTAKEQPVDQVAEVPKTLTFVKEQNKPIVSPSLVVSDTILGKDASVFYSPVFHALSRIRLARYCRVPRVSPGSCGSG